MSIPAKPIPLHQGPANSCVIGGHALGWLNCTPTSVAMAVTKSTLKAKRADPCTVRRLTGDTTGGTTLAQCVHAAHVGYRVDASVHVGNNALSPTRFAALLHAGHGTVVQGYTGVLVKTKFRSTAGGVNHAIYVNSGRGWHKNSAGHWVPSEVLVYDPAADGRKSWWGTATSSPDWWPWSLLKAFASHLHPWGESDKRLLGPGRIYSAVFPDTEPHAHFHYSSARTLPFPDRTRIDVPAGHRANVRARPDRMNRSDIVGHKARGKLFVAYQVAHGATPRGSNSNVWYGSHSGRRWIHSSNLRAIGGSR